MKLIKSKRSGVVHAPKFPNSVQESMRVRTLCSDIGIRVDEIIEGSIENITCKKCINSQRTPLNMLMELKTR